MCIAKSKSCCAAATALLCPPLVLQQATEVRKEVNELDNLTTAKAIDSLINYETVKLFNNELLEVTQYDQYLVGFQVRELFSISAAGVLRSVQRRWAILLWSIFGASAAVCTSLYHFAPELIMWRCAYILTTIVDSVTRKHVWSLPV